MVASNASATCLAGEKQHSSLKSAILHSQGWGEYSKPPSQSYYHELFIEEESLRWCILPHKPSLSCESHLGTYVL